MDDESDLCVNDGCDTEFGRINEHILSPYVAFAEKAQSSMTEIWKTQTMLHRKTRAVKNDIVDTHEHILVIKQKIQDLSQCIKRTQRLGHAMTQIRACMDDLQQRSEMLLQRRKELDLLDEQETLRENVAIAAKDFSEKAPNNS